MTILLFGDSIFRGSAVVRRPDLLGEEEARQIPLWFLRTPAAVMNLVLGEDVARFGGQLRLLGAGVEESLRDIQSALESGKVGPGDVVIMLDVGRHSCNPSAGEDVWRRLRAAVAEHYAVRLLICEGFDDGARGQASHQYDWPFDGRSMNQATRNAAMESQPSHSGRTEFVPLMASIASYHRWLGDRFSLSAYRRDGIHLNVWGQFRLCGLLLHAAMSEWTPDLEVLLSTVVEREAYMDLKGNALKAALIEAFQPPLC